MSACELHPNEPRLGYLQAHADAEARMKRGERQVRCEQCGLWVWSEFMTNIKWLIEYREDGKTVGYLKDINRNGTYDVYMTKDVNSAQQFTDKDFPASIIASEGFIHAMGEDRAARFAVEEHIFNCGTNEKGPPQ